MKSSIRVSSCPFQNTLRTGLPRFPTHARHHPLPVQRFHGPAHTTPTTQRSPPNDHQTCRCPTPHRNPFVAGRVTAARPRTVSRTVVRVPVSVPLSRLSQARSRSGRDTHKPKNYCRDRRGLAARGETSFLLTPTADRAELSPTRSGIVRWLWENVNRSNSRCFW